MLKLMLEQWQRIVGLLIKATSGEWWSLERRLPVESCLPTCRSGILQARITEGIQEYKSYCVCKFVH